MFSFLQPIWLYAIAGIVIPIAIHFWNIKEGKAFPVGSIILLEKSTKKYTRTLRINEWLLLLLRCLLIIFLACLLAKPVKQQIFDQQKGWVLLDKENTNAVYQHFKTAVDSLLNAGYTLRRFDNKFEPISLKDALASADTISSQTAYWSLIKKVNNKVPSSFPVYVFTADHLKNFRGARPQVSANIKWYAYSQDSSVKQIVKAWITDEKNIRVMLANSTSQGNMFIYEDVQTNQERSSEYKISSSNGALSVAYNNQQPVIVDTAIMHISIYAGKYRQDANYIKASLDAIQQFTKKNIQTNVITNISSVAQKNDWLFWLSNGPVPKNIAAKNILQYVQGKEQPVSSVINISQPIAIKKRIAADSLPEASTILWKDGFGDPLLIKEESGNINIYHFYSHFNPQWNDLVWNDVFPSLLLRLIFKDDIENINNAYDDIRTVDVHQMQPAYIKAGHKPTSFASEDISVVCWVIIFLLFCVERMLSFKTKSIAA